MKTGLANRELCAIVIKKEKNMPLPAKPIPIKEMREFIKVDPTSKTGMRWVKSSAKRVKVGDEAGNYSKSTGYYVIGFNGKEYKAHRIVYALYHQEDPGELEIDHKNKIKTDNRIENLRVASRSLQNKNRKGYGKSKYKGVYYDGRQKKPWYARIILNGKKKYLGYYYTEEEAMQAAKKAFIERDGYYM